MWELPKIFPDKLDMARLFFGTEGCRLFCCFAQDLRGYDLAVLRKVTELDAVRRLVVIFARVLEYTCLIEPEAPEFL